MSKIINQRHIALQKMGGAKQVHSLPREKRARILASLMDEGITKVRSGKVCSMAAFECALERGDVAAAKKYSESFYDLFGLFSLRDLVIAKVKTLRDEKQESTANMFEVAFDLNEKARLGFVEHMEDLLNEAEQKLNADYSFAFVLFSQILDKEKMAGVDCCTEAAAVGLATNYLRSRRLNEAMDIIEEHLLKDGKVSGVARIKLIPEIQKMMGRTTEHALIKFAKNSEKRGLLPLMQESILGLTSEGMFEDVERCKMVFGLMLIFELTQDARSLGAYLVNLKIGMADAHPEKSAEEYLDAARIASRIGLMDEMDEAMDKYLAVVGGSENKDEFLLIEAGARAAMEFSRTDVAQKLGEQAVGLFLREGMLEQAENVAHELRLTPLHAQVVEMRKRIGQ